MPRALFSSAALASAWRLALGGLVAGAGLAVAPAAMADGEYPEMLSKADRQRIDNFDEIRRSTLAFARQHGAPADVKVVDAAMAGNAQKLDVAKITGDWRCRVIKLAKDQALPIVVYADFRCRIEDQDQGLWLDKLSGSQRTHGGFWDIGEARMAYVGALQLPDDPVEPAYGQAADRDQVGYLVPLSGKHMRLEMPTQNTEADLEVLEFRR